MTGTWRSTSGAPGAAGVAFALAVVLAASGCTERLAAPGECPTTCSGAAAQIRTIDLDAAVVADTSVLGGLGLGTEPQMLLASRGDTLDTRVVIRFDSLPSRSRPRNSDTTTVPINYVDSAYLALHLDSAAAAATAPVTLSVYDVAAAANDTAVASLAPLFDAAHHVIDTTFAPGKLVDSVHVRLPNAFLLAKAQARAPLRLGLRLTGGGSAQTRIYASSTTAPPRLSMRTSADTAVPRISLAPYSATPVGNSSIAASLADFTVVVKGTASSTAPGLLAVGGLPARRAYLRFDLPSRIVDSSIVVRAALLLTQLPSAAPDAGDTMAVMPVIVVAGPAVTEVGKAAQITGNTLLAFAPLKLIPGASGVRTAEIAPAFGAWAAQSDTALPRALVLASAREDYSPQEVLFYSTSAADPAVRPRLRVSYTLRSRIGLP